MQPSGIAIADLDGDGRPDLAIANYGSPDDPSTASLAVMLQDPLQPGTFQTATDYDTPDRSATEAVGDLNGDGKPDLAVASNGSLASDCGVSDCNSSTARAGVSVFLQSASQPGRFEASTNYATVNQAMAVAIADVNGDGKLDLVILDDQGVLIRLQDPAHAGTFLDATRLKQPCCGIGGEHCGSSSSIGYS